MRNLVAIFNKRNILFGISKTEAAGNIMKDTTSQDIKDYCENKTTTSSGYSYRYISDYSIDYLTLMGGMTLAEFDQMN